MNCLYPSLLCAATISYVLTAPSLSQLPSAEGIKKEQIVPQAETAPKEEAVARTKLGIRKYLEHKALFIKTDYSGYIGGPSKAEKGDESEVQKNFSPTGWPTITSQSPLPTANENLGINAPSLSYLPTQLGGNQQFQYVWEKFPVPNQERQSIPTTYWQNPKIEHFYVVKQHNPSQDFLFSPNAAPKVINNGESSGHTGYGYNRIGSKGGVAQHKAVYDTTSLTERELHYFKKFLAHHGMTLDGEYIVQHDGPNSKEIADKKETNVKDFTATADNQEGNNVKTPTLPVNFANGKNGGATSGWYLNEFYTAPAVAHGPNAQSEHNTAGKISGGYYGENYPFNQYFRQHSSAERPIYNSFQEAQQRFRAQDELLYHGLQVNHVSQVIPGGQHAQESVNGQYSKKVQDTPVGKEELVVQISHKVSQESPVTEQVQDDLEAQVTKETQGTEEAHVTQETWEPHKHHGESEAQVSHVDNIAQEIKEVSETKLQTLDKDDLVIQPSQDFSAGKSAESKYEPEAGIEFAPTNEGRERYSIHSTPSYHVDAITNEPVELLQGGGKGSEWSGLAEGSPSGRYLPSTGGKAPTSKGPYQSNGEETVTENTASVDQVSEMPNQGGISDTSTSEHDLPSGKQNEPVKYRFRYEVNDEKTGDIKSHEEEKDGDITKGTYSLHEPDGTIRTVIYQVIGPSGFLAMVNRMKIAKEQSETPVAKSDS